MVKRQRRKVSDEEFQRALASRDNKHVARSVLALYKKILTSDDLHGCWLRALWRSLQYHQPDYNQKFTTSLYRFTHWECRREYRRQKQQASPGGHLLVPFYDEGLATTPNHTDEDIDHIHSRMALLTDENHRRLIDQYYFQGLSLEQVGQANGYSKESARKKIRRAVAALRELCLEDLS